MSQGEFTKDEAQATMDAFLEVAKSLSAAKKAEFFGHANDIMLFLEAAKRAAPHGPAPSPRLVPAPTPAGTQMSMKILGNKEWTDRSMDTIEQVHRQAQGAKLSFDEHGDAIGPHQWPNWSNFFRDFTRTRPGLLLRVHLHGLSFFFYHKGLVHSSQYDPEYNGCLHANTDKPWR